MKRNMEADIDDADIIVDSNISSNTDIWVYGNYIQSLLCCGNRS